MSQATGARLKKKQPCKIFYFSDYQEIKPFFTGTEKIIVGAPEYKTYHLIKNIVYNEKQIVALQQEKDSTDIIVAQAIIEDGKLKNLSKISEELLNDIESILHRSIELTNSGVDYET